MTVYTNATVAFLTELGINMDGGDIVTVRDMETKERRNVVITLTKPWQRLFVLPYRNDDIVAKVAETAWQLAGRDDIEWLSYYLPRAPEFSDNGFTWRGAYGPRLRNWNGSSYKIDQISVVAQKLRNDPNTRQAILSLWEPTIDLRPGKDIPCNNWIHFLIRDGLLHMNVAQRSSDAVWGYSGIDAFSWSVLHELMANWTGTQMGEFTHFISSFHVYDRHYDRANKILEGYTNRTIYDWDLPRVELSWDDVGCMDEDLGQLFVAEAVWRAGYSEYYAIPGNAVIDLWGRILWVYCHIKSMRTLNKNANPEFIGELVNGIPASDWRVAMVEWLYRKLPAATSYINLTDVEVQALMGVMLSIRASLGNWK